MKGRQRIISILLSAMVVLGCGSLMQIDNRLLMKPVLAIVPDFVAQTKSEEQPAQPSNSPTKDDSLDTTENTPLINQILNHQAQEGNAILEDEINLRQQEIRDRLDLFEGRRKHEIAAAVKTKEASLNQELTQKLADKLADNQSALHKYELDLEESQKVNLVNLRLKLGAISLDRKSNSFDEDEQELTDRIEQIRQEISQKSETEKGRLDKDYQDFETVARQRNTQELSEYQRTLNDEFQSDYKTLKESLEQEFSAWRDEQETRLNQAMELRKIKK